MPAVRSAFDVAFWFADTALNSNEYLQPQKLHRLMFLAQAYFGLAYDGRLLMPAMFVADEMGPIEPNVFAAYSKGRPDVEVELFLPEEVEGFLGNIWRRFGHYSADKLTKLTKETAAYKRAYKKAPRSEITLDSMLLSFGRAQETPGIDRVVKPKVLRTQTGKPVTVSAWTPRAVDPKQVTRAPTLPPGGEEEPGAPVAKPWTPGGADSASPPAASPTPDSRISAKERIRARQMMKQKQDAERARHIQSWAPRVVKRNNEDD